MNDRVDGMFCAWLMPGLCLAYQHEIDGTAIIPSPRRLCRPVSLSFVVLPTRQRRVLDAAYRTEDVRVRLYVCMCVCVYVEYVGACGRSIWPLAGRLRKASSFSICTLQASRRAVLADVCWWVGEGKGEGRMHACMYDYYCTVMWLCERQDLLSRATGWMGMSCHAA